MVNKCKMLLSGSNKSKKVLNGLRGSKQMMDTESSSEESSDQTDDGFEQGPRRAKYKKRCYKRKIYTKAEKQSIMGKLKHPVLPGCESKCSKKCSLKISEEQRNKLHETYWDIVDRRERKFWMSKHIKQVPVKKRTFIFSKREGTCLYFLPLSSNDSEEVSVCQKFFLTTFGFTHCHIIKSVKNAYSFEELPLPEKEYKEDKRKGPRKRASSSEVMVTSKLETEEDLLYEDSNRASSDSYQLQSEIGVKKEFLAEANKEVKHSKSVGTKIYPIPDDIRPLLKKRARTEEDQIYNEKLLHPMREGCTTICPRKCCSKFTEEQRRNIYETFWKLDRKNQHEWVSKLVMQEPVERRTSSGKRAERLRSLYYHLPISADCPTNNIRVCRKIFLATIGYSSPRKVCRIINLPEFRDKFIPPLPFERRQSRYVKKKDRVITRENSFSNSVPCENHDVTTLLENSLTLLDISIASEAVNNVEQETLFKSKHSSVTDHVSSEFSSTQVRIDMEAKIDDSWSNPPSDSSDEEDEDVMDEETTDVEHEAKKRSISSPVRKSKRQRGQPPNERIERSTNKRKHDMKPGCGNDCKRNCSKIISEEQRMWLHCTCWQIMDKEARLVWMSKFIREKPIAYYFNILETKRTTTLYCFLPTSADEESSLVPVCQTFFVNTFGYTVHIIECLRKKFKTFQPCPVQAKIRKSRDQTKIGNTCSSEAGNDTTVVGVQPAESRWNNSAIITDDFDAEEINEVEHSKPVRTKTYPIPDDIKPLLKKRARTKEDQIHNAKLLHPMKAGCTSVCPRKCCTKFTEEQRRNIYETFWKLDRKNRNKWVSKLLMQEPIERRTNADKQSRRLRSLYYHLPTSSDCTADNVRVCKRFFLATIGHSYSQIIGQITNSPEFHDQFMPPLPFEKRSWSRYKKKDGGINQKNSFNNNIPGENHEATTLLLENSQTLPDIPTASEAVDDVEQETLFKSKHSSVTDHVSSDPISTQVPIDMEAKIDDSWSNPPSDSSDEEDEDVMDEETTDVEHSLPGAEANNEVNHSKPVRTNTYPIPDDIKPLLKKPARTKEDQIYNAKLLHPMKAGCTSVCPRKCCTKFTEEQRRNIYETFWKLDRKNRNKWVSKFLMQEPIERRTNADKQSRRLRSLYYHLPTSSDCTADNVRVCKRFFLATIGHSYSQIIHHIITSPVFRDQFMPPLPFEKRSWSRYQKKDGGINQKNSFNNNIPGENHEATTLLLENSSTLPIIPTAETTDVEHVPPEENCNAANKSKTPEPNLTRKYPVSNDVKPYLRERRRSVKEQMQNAERLHQMRRNAKLLHPMRIGCTACAKKCCTKFTDKQRRNIYENYWKLDKKNRHLWVSKFVTQVPIDHRKSDDRNVDKRVATLFYHLPLSPDCSSDPIVVCQKYFLATIGHSRERMITRLMKSPEFQDKFIPTLPQTSPQKPKEKRVPRSGKQDIAKQDDEMSNKLSEDADTLCYLLGLRGPIGFNPSRPRNLDPDYDQCNETSNKDGNSDMNPKYDQCNETLNNDGNPDMDPKYDRCNETSNNDGNSDMDPNYKQCNETSNNDGNPDMDPNYNQCNETSNNDGNSDMNPNYNQCNETSDNDGNSDMDPDYNPRDSPNNDGEKKSSNKIEHQSIKRPGRNKKHHSDRNNDDSDSNHIDKGDASSISSAKKRRLSRHPHTSSSQTDGTDDMKALIKSNCNFACGKRCPTKFKEGLCKKVRDSFWALDEAGRKRWLARFVENEDVDERKTGRPHKLFYFFPTLPNSRGDKISVCQKFFFVALGYENSCTIAELLQQLSPPELSDQSVVKVETSGVAFQDEHLQGSGTSNGDDDSLHFEEPDHGLIEPSSVESKSAEIPKHPKRSAKLQQRILKARQAHPMLPRQDCRLKFSSKFTEEHRQQIHDQFWQLEYKQRRAWMCRYLIDMPVRRRTLTGLNSTSRRSRSYLFFLPSIDGRNEIQVCKGCFIATLGFRYKNLAILSHVSTNTPENDGTATNGEEESTEQTDTFCESRNQDESKELGIKDCFVRVRKLDTRNLDGNTIVAPLKEECDASIDESNDFIDCVPGEPFHGSIGASPEEQDCIVKKEEVDDDYTGIEDNNYQTIKTDS